MPDHCSRTKVRFARIFEFDLNVFLKGCILGLHYPSFSVQKNLQVFIKSKISISTLERHSIIHYGVMIN